jgi:hypothetical protein
MNSRRISESKRLSLAIAAALVWTAAAKADTFANSSIDNPEQCGAVCIGPFIAADTGHLVGNSLLTSSVNDEFNYARAFITLNTGAMGTQLAADAGTAQTNAEHDDTWFCSNPSQCAALQTPGTLIPVDLNFHIAASGSLVPEGGFMSLTYTYFVYSVLGSTAGGLLQFSFGQDPGLGPHAVIDASGSFRDNTTGRSVPVQAIFSPEAVNSDQFAFSANLTVQSFIGGCPTAGCDLSNGIFGDVQQLSAAIEDDNVNVDEVLDSSHTFSVGLSANLPFVSQDGRQASPIPEPATCFIAAAGFALLLLRRRRAC